MSARRWSEMPDAEAAMHVIREMRKSLLEIAECELACGHPVISKRERLEFMESLNNLIRTYGDCEIVPIDGRNA